MRLRTGHDVSGELRQVLEMADAALGKAGVELLGMLWANEGIVCRRLDWHEGEFLAYNSKECELLFHSSGMRPVEWLPKLHDITTRDWVIAEVNSSEREET